MSKKNTSIVENENPHDLSQEYHDLKVQYNQLQEEYNQLNEKYKVTEENNQKVLRTAAHIQNLYNEIKDKLPKEVQRETKKIKQDIFNHIIKFIDMLELTLNTINGQNNEDAVIKSIINGINMVHSYIINDLSTNFNLKKIPCNIGDEFDANIHDAQQQIATDDGNLHNTIAKIISNGYSLDGTTLTYVIVGVYIKN